MFFVMGKLGLPPVAAIRGLGASATPTDSYCPRWTLYVLKHYVYGIWHVIGIERLSQHLCLAKIMYRV